jgi:hypothetical protein
LEQSHSTRLLTTRLRAGVAVALTAFVFAFAVRDVLHPHYMRQWPVPWYFLLHGWPLLAVNVVFYCYLSWLAFWLIRGTHGRERVVMVGWFVSILLAPLENVWRGPVAIMRYAEMFGLLVALLAAIAILLDFTTVSDSGTRPAQRGCREIGLSQVAARGRFEGGEKCRCAAGFVTRRYLCESKFWGLNFHEFTLVASSPPRRAVCAGERAGDSSSRCP